MNIAHSKIGMPYLRRGFTLVELLMVISILAVLGGLALSMIGGARHDANAARTETQIRRIKQFIEARLEDYSVRLLALQLRNFNDGGTPLTLPQIQQIRNRILVEYVNAEMPSGIDNINLRPVIPGPPATYPSQHFKDDFPNVGDVNGTLIAQMQAKPSALSQRITRLLSQVLPQGAPADQGNADTFGAECLYEILNSHNDAYSSGLDFLFPGEIGDTDGDRHFEVLDSWGDSLLFVLTLDEISLQPPDRFTDEPPMESFALPFNPGVTSLQNYEIPSTIQPNPVPTPPLVLPPPPLAPGPPALPPEPSTTTPAVDLKGSFVVRIYLKSVNMRDR